jgi:hypothetical protein
MDRGSDCGGAARLGKAVASVGHLECNVGMTDEPLPDDLATEDVHQLVAILDKLFSTTAPDDHGRYVATKQVLWQTIATMMTKGVDDEVAMQTILAVAMELLTRSAGPTGAAAQLRLMANKIASLQRDIHR